MKKITYVLSLALSLVCFHIYSSDIYIVYDKRSNTTIDLYKSFVKTKGDWLVFKEKALSSILPNVRLNCCRFSPSILGIIIRDLIYINPNKNLTLMVADEEIAKELRYLINQYQGKATVEVVKQNFNGYCKKNLTDYQYTKEFGTQRLAINYEKVKKGIKLRVQVEGLPELLWIKITDLPAEMTCYELKIKLLEYIKNMTIDIFFSFCLISFLFLFLFSSFLYTSFSYF